MSRIQLKIIGVLALLVIVVVTASGILAERGLRERETRNIRDHLERETRLVSQQVAGIAFEPMRADELQRIAATSAQAAAARVTLIDPSGRVVADSEVPADEIPDLSNHADRPEIAQAIRSGSGYSLRRSDTLKRSLLYVAVRVPGAADGRSDGVVRLAVHLDQLDAATAELRGQLVVAGGVGLLAALLLSYALSLLSLRPIRELREVVSDIAAGKLGSRLAWENQDERGEIAASINRLARQMRESADAALRDKTRLEAVLSSMVEGVVAIDRDGRILLVNPRAQEMLGVWGDFEGRSVPEVIRSPQVDAALRDAVKAAGILVRELEVQADTRRILLMHASGFPRTDRQGTVAVFHDVTELRRVDEIRRDFVANASHELRTPLTAIQGFARALQEPDVDAEQLAKYLDVIVRNTQRMSHLIDDLLTLSQIESGATTLQLDALDVRRVIEIVLADFAPRLRETNLVAQLHADEVPLCRADRGALEQILSNLLSNAVRYSNPATRIDIGCRVRDAHVEISVTDAGIGIPADELERIFERFYRVPSARSRALGSTGLGLSIVKHLVRAMHGEIHAESEPGKGSCFRFTLPIA